MERPWEKVELWKREEALPPLKVSDLKKTGHFVKCYDGSGSGCVHPQTPMDLSSEDMEDLFLSFFQFP